MLLQDGHRYKNRNGIEITVTLRYPHSMHPFVDDTEMRYMSDGRYTDNAVSPVACFDLIEEIKP